MTVSSQPIHFTKMHALGNDFMIVNAIEKKQDAKEWPIKQWADRYTGIGFDQLLVVERSQHADFFCHIWNADGSVAEQCGNGLRCVARWVHESGLEKKSSFTIETVAGVTPVIIHDNDHIELTLNPPHLQTLSLDLRLQQSPQPLSVSVLSLGNPHAILTVESVDAIVVHQLGAEISSHHQFPHGVNVGFMEIVHPTHIRLRTFERGIGETHACGSNACAAVIAGIMKGILQHEVKVEYRYGYLTVIWEGEGKHVHLIGPATHVFSGKLP